MSTPGHITITRLNNGPSTRVSRIMLIGSLGSHVSSRVCVSFAVNLGTVGQSLLSTLLQLDVRIQGLLLGCVVISLLWCKSHFSSTQSLDCKPLHDSQQLVRCLRAGKSLVRAAWRQATCQVASTQASTSKNEITKVCVYRWRMILSWWICWLAKLSCGSLRPVVKDGQTALRRTHPDLWGGGQSEADLNKR